MTKQEIVSLQHELNRFVETYLAGVAPLLADGKFGHSTQGRIKTVKYYLGYERPINDEPNDDFKHRMRHPKDVRFSTKERIERGNRRRALQRRRAEDQERELAKATGFGKFEGMTVAAWMIPWLKKTRAYRGRHGAWQGRVVSGVRTPAYSEHLCYAMCGAPRCPGRCAGRASNHNMLQSQGKPHGALDVSDYVRFGRIQKEIGSPLKNTLGARDPVHFSVSGS